MPKGKNVKKGLPKEVSRGKREKHFTYRVVLLLSGGKETRVSPSS